MQSRKGARHYIVGVGLTNIQRRESGRQIPVVCYRKRWYVDAVSI